MKSAIWIVCVATLLAVSCGGKQTPKEVTEVKEVSGTKKDSTVKPEEALKAAAASPEGIKLPAQLLAYREVSIYPKVNGYVKTVLVDIGSQVKQGQLLMQLEAPELLQQTVQAKEKYSHTQSDYMLSKERYMRLKEASLTEGAISPMDLDVARSRMQADSVLSRAEQANVNVQHIMSEYLQVTAPFSGVITLRNVNPGTLVSAVSKDNPMLELKQIDHLRLKVDVPEMIAGSLKPGDELRFYLSSKPDQPLKAAVSRMSHNLDVQYRTERVELDVPNASGTLSAGMYAEVLFPSEPAAPRRLPASGAPGNSK